MDPIQIRALRNGIVAAVVTALAGFALIGLFGEDTGGTSTASVSATPSRTPACRPNIEPLSRDRSRGVGATILGLWAASPTDAWAVGYVGAPEVAAIAEAARWDGTEWSPVDGPDTAIVDVLTDVDGMTPDDVWASGWASDGGEASPLLAHWDGSAWGVVPGPTDIVGGMTFDGVAAVAADEVWAVGHTGDPEEGTEVAAVVHWDGSSWGAVPVPVGGGRSRLWSVDASGPDDVWAVGYHRRGPLVLHFDGTAWERVLDVEARGELRSVSAVGPDEAWAIGSSILRWDGTSWIPIGTSPRDATLAAVEAVPGDGAWVVGTSEDEQTGRAIAFQVSADGLGRPVRATIPGSENLTSVAFADGVAWTAGYRRTENGISPVFARLAGCA